MKAMILAAGQGERMRPLTDSIPKPLLEAGGKPLLQYHIENLAKAGVRKIVINHARLGHLIEQRFSNGREFGVDIVYSAEGDTPLETGGGMKKALSLLGENPFIVVNADIWTDYDFSRLPAAPAGLAHLVLVANPSQHPAGDFCLSNGFIKNTGDALLTYSGIGVYTLDLIMASDETAFSIIPLVRAAAEVRKVRGEFYDGEWRDIGTPERLSQLDHDLNILGSSD